MSSYSKRTWLVGLGLIASLCLTSCKEQTPAFRVGSGGTLGNYHVAARTIVRLVNDRQNVHGFLLEEELTSGSVANIDGILSGEIAFGIAQADREFQALNGLGEWTERGPQKKLRALFSLHTDSITLVASPASGVEVIQDLIGMRVDIGHPDSGAHQNAIDALEAAGIDWRRDLLTSEETPDARASKYLGEELDAFFNVVGHPAMDIKFAVNSVPGARFVPLVNIEELLAKHPYYSRASIPIDLYPGVRNESDVESVGVKAIFLTSEETPNDVVYALTRSVFEQVDALGQFAPVLQTLTRQSMLEGMSAPIHPGALEYFMEAGLAPAAAGQSN